MCKLIPAMLVGLVVLGGPVLAQEYPPEQVAMVKSFYRKYLNREVEPEGLTNWLNHLENGASPTWVLSGILASNEYYSKGGGTDAGYIRSLFLDLAGREPSRSELRQWQYRMNRVTHQEIASELMMRFRRPR